ncbi:hypothetical protein [Lacibacter cauensis]|nr:hypothetical protein [Lacibacter cauensis]
MKQLLAGLVLMIAVKSHAQMVEYFAGDKRTGIDIMWFKNFQNKQKAKTAFLYFSRNRASVSYKQGSAAMGSTNAVSYNFKNGLGLVTVASFVNAGFVPKAGVQYYRQSGNFMFFGWLVSDIKKQGNVDLFGLFRYQPTVSENWRGLLQMELFPVYQPSSELWNIIERVRLGAKYRAWSRGLMMDFQQTGKNNFIGTSNLGAFIRYEF